MPRFHQHLAINIGVLTAIELRTQAQEKATDPAQDFDWGRLLVNVGVGAFAGARPDHFEPSLGNPGHRGFWHSAAAAVLIWWVVSGRHTKELQAILLLKCTSARKGCLDYSR